MAGLLYAYMGPEPAPLLPRWDCLVREDGKRWVTIESMLECNWLQPMENSVDPSHLFWLHGAIATHVRELGQYNEKYEFIPFEYGIIKRRIAQGKKPGDPTRTDEHPLIFPTMLRHVSVADRGQLNNRFRHNIQIRVPVDDTHTQVYRVNFVPSDTDRSPEDQDPPYEYSPLKDETGEYRMNTVSAQDAMAWETQGAITDRMKEHLGTGDRGIVMFRRLLREQIEIVQKGGEPIGIIRDPAKNEIIDIDVVNEAIGLYRQAAVSAKVRAEAS
jgi:5,5'-dehydrodivanillate O-demethylase oxygenase subunit